MPGLKQTAARSVAGAVKRRLLVLGREKFLEYGDQIVQETGQELLKIWFEGLAEKIAGVPAPEDKRPALERLWETATQTMKTVPFLMGPKIATDTVVAVRGSGQRAGTATGKVAKPRLLDALTPEQQAHVAAASNSEEMLARYQEILGKAHRGEISQRGDPNSSALRFSKAPSVEEHVGRVVIDLAQDERTAALGPTPTAKNPKGCPKSRNGHEKC